MIAASAGSINVPCCVLVFRPLMARTSKRPFVRAIKRFYRIPFVQKVKAIFQDVALVALIIVGLKAISRLMEWAAFAPWLQHSFAVVKGVIFLIVYIVLSHEVLDELGLWKMIAKIQEAVRGKDGSSSSLVAA